jgi:hypothetical protein
MRCRVLLFAILVSLAPLTAARADAPVDRLDIVEADYGAGFVSASGQVQIISVSAQDFDKVIVIVDNTINFTAAFRAYTWYQNGNLTVLLAPDRSAGVVWIISIWSYGDGTYLIGAEGIVWYVIPAGN